jgi:sugar lactone lactonase YvrE
MKIGLLINERSIRMRGKLELFVDAKSELGEGPLWVSEVQTLFWVDLVAGTINWIDALSGDHHTFQTGQYVGCIVKKQSGGFLLALQNGIYELNKSMKQLTFLTDPEISMTDNRFNDGKCDPQGRFWAGTMSMKGVKGAGTLYCFEKNLSCRDVIHNVSISNGIGWSPDEKRMYYIDSAAKEVYVYQYDKVSGLISNPRTAISFYDQKGLPDGMAVDEEGMLWIAHWDGGQVSRWNPYTGKLLESIAVPAKHVTSCAFGGPNMDELYITTARVDMSLKELEQYPHSGSVFRFKTNTKGLPVHSFAG